MVLISVLERVAEQSALDVEEIGAETHYGAPALPGQAGAPVLAAQYGHER